MIEVSVGENSSNNVCFHFVSFFEESEDVPAHINSYGLGKERYRKKNKDRDEIEEDNQDKRQEVRA
jgi:hypothetical protein